MGRRLLSAIAAAALVLTAQLSVAQNVRESVLADPENAANIYHPYQQREGKMTPAPKGYKPFYISHYGRHGSRYLTGDYYFFASKGLEEAKSQGLLTKEGQELYDEYFAIVKEHAGMYGQLTPRGAREHRAIARRMFSRFPEVFESKDRDMIHCVSTVVPRCIVSMTNFTTQLNDLNPKLDFTYTTGDKYFDVLSHDINSERLYKEVGDNEAAMRSSICHYDKFFRRIFTDPAAAEKAVGNPQSFIKSIFNVACICEDLDWMGINLYKHFDPEELAQQAIVRSDVVYGQLGNSKEWGDTVGHAARFLARDFVEKADKALESGSNVAADLRFGHDTGILPFLTLLQVEGNDDPKPFAEGHETWSATRMIPMGTNFQMIFFRSRKGPILVKMLYNEAETAIKAVPAYSGPYYRWSDLRDYFLKISED